MSNCSFTGDVEQKMKVLHVCELGLQLVALVAFISLCPKRTCDYSRVVTCPERFCAFGRGRIAKNELCISAQHGTKTAPRRHRANDCRPGVTGRLHFEWGIIV